MMLLLLCLPWILVGLFMVLFVRVPRRLPPLEEWGGEGAPSVSIIVPARNEEANLPNLLSSLAATRYPDVEIIVVDDESQDRTRELAEGAPAGNARGIRVIQGEPPPEGWFGKPWACHQGSNVAQGDLLLFTDADTVHEADLLGRAVQGLLREEADALTVLGRQLMESFWERLVQPQFFMLLAFRFPRTGVPKRPKQWKDAIANGQYILFHREVYDALGGHEAVKGEVVEDMRLAQLLVQAGQRLVVREGQGLKTRMYRSLGGLVEGWSKNVTTGALQTTPVWLLGLVLPLSFLLGLILWLLPPAVLVWSALAGGGGIPFAFGATITGSSVIFWGLATAIMRGNPLYGFLYPVGALLSAYIFLRSWIRGNRIQWKGREYTMTLEARRGMRGTGGP
jgi:chlorobactene glucosyltransferase